MPTRQEEAMRRYVDPAEQLVTEILVAGTRRSIDFYRSLGFERQVMVPDVDSCWKLANAIRAPIVIPLADRYYGLRDFTIADPDGFGVRFASLLERRG